MSRPLRALLLGTTLLLAACAGPKRLPPVDEIPPREVGPALPVLLGVGLVENAETVDLSAAGRAELRDGAGRLLAVLEAGATVSCRRRGAAVAFHTDSRAGVKDHLVLRPVDPEVLVSHGDAPYAGVLAVRPTPGGAGLTVINEVELETYLRGVVPWEIGRHSRRELAALEAQAVAARTYTISHLGVRKDRGFDVHGGVMDQVYRGAADQDPLCNEAIERTRGLVLRHEGKEIEAYYSASCGGVSSLIQDVWPRGAQPYLVSHRDGGSGDEAYCAWSSHSSWEESWPRARLELVLAETLPAYLEHMARPDRAAWAGPVFTARAGGDPRRPGRLRHLEIVRRTTSGRVADLVAITDAGTYHLRGDRVRWVFPPPGGHPSILRSAFFDLELVHRDGSLAEIVMRGQGYGHGIGMCQVGALGMARRGHDVRSILGHYYPGTVLARVRR
ncbi:MAG: SpoIID/LytB domain-containing protein [bacterium]|nr:SpoIID/LytB domain-containing protein [bacterium]